MQGTQYFYTPLTMQYRLLLFESICDPVTSTYSLVFHFMNNIDYLLSVRLCTFQWLNSRANKAVTCIVIVFMESQTDDGNFYHDINMYVQYLLQYQ